MADEMTEFNHPDSIWTWKTAKGRKRATLWLPYVQSIERAKPRSKTLYRFIYNGGDFEADLRQIDCIMIYGATGALPVSFLDSLSVHGIHLIIHRRGMPQPYVFLPSQGALSRDALTAQITARQNRNRRVYIARTLIKARLQTMAKVLPMPATVYSRLAKTRDLQGIRALEAHATKRYWSLYYANLGCPGSSRRDDSLPINQALDAASFFMFGILLRWVTLHRLSPWHGFLHEPTTYAALCYDLMEPYRVWFEEAAAQAFIELGDQPAKLTGATISNLKEALEMDVQVPQTRQVVARKNLLHGVTLGLLSYVSRESVRFIIPVEGIKKAGRPLRSGYKIPGEKLKSGW